MSVILAAWLAASSPAPELAVADRRIGPWRMSVATYVDPATTPPTIKDIRCSVRNRGFSLVLSRFGGAAVSFGGDGTGFSLAGMRAVTIDRARWEARMIPIHPAERYADVDYPPDHPTTLGDGDRYLGVRRSADEPWLHLETLVDELAEGRTLAVEHGSGVFRLPLGGLERALRWCAATMESRRARLYRR